MPRPLWTSDDGCCLGGKSKNERYVVCVVCVPIFKGKQKKGKKKEWKGRRIGSWVGRSGASERRAVEGQEKLMAFETDERFVGVLTLLCESLLTGRRLPR